MQSAKFFASLVPIAKYYYSGPDLSIHTKVKHGGSSLQQAHSYSYYNFTMQVPAHTTLVRYSKQAMATTSTLLRYTIVVGPDAASQGPSNITLQVANRLRTRELFIELKEGRAGFSYQLLPQQSSLLLRLR